jgi:hypothetical protein
MVANALRNQVSRLGRPSEGELAKDAGYQAALEQEKSEAAQAAAAKALAEGKPVAQAMAEAMDARHAVTQEAVKAGADALIAQAHAATKVHKFSETAAGLDASLPRLPMGDLINETIILISVGEFNGKFGEGNRVVCLREATGERFVLTGNWAVVGDTIRKLAEDGDLPCRVKVIRAVGQRYFQFTDPDVEPVIPAGAASDVPIF